ESHHQRGVLFSSGLVAGDAIIGVVVAIFVATVPAYRAFYDAHNDIHTSLSGEFGLWMSLLLFAGLGVYGYRYFRSNADK
ncbi:MAG TPA: hypothetical protein VLB27_10900, partial [candidate division Zixibacteria bacterium]|nr:hypothetical protein [candidate division Zixibacteria bacterium]